MPASNKLSIYLIKDEFSDDDRKILKSNYRDLTNIDGLGKAYYCPSAIVKPKWVESFFCGRIEKK